MPVFENRYESMRAVVPDRMRKVLMAAFAECLAEDPHTEADLHFADEAFWSNHSVCFAMPDGIPMRCTTTVEVEHRTGIVREHISVRSEQQGHMPGVRALMLIRALAWPDDVAVEWVLPPQAGPHAVEWTPTEGVEVMHLWRTRPPETAAEQDGHQSCGASDCADDEPCWRCRHEMEEARRAEGPT